MCKIYIKINISLLLVYKIEKKRVSKTLTGVSLKCSNVKIN